MSRQNYQQDLENLRSDVQSMADLVLDRYGDALDAYATEDEALAESVIDGDHEINMLYLDLEGSCVELLALQQPVASDLRLITASFKILTDLERVGDLAVNLSDYATWEAEAVISPSEIRTLGETAGVMLDDAVAAYEKNDIDRAQSIAAFDDVLDDDCEAASNRVIRGLLADDPSTLTDDEIERRLIDVKRTLLTIRDIERIGDHAVNICARTLYMVDNDPELIY